MREQRRDKLCTLLLWEESPLRLMFNFHVRGKLCQFAGRYSKSSPSIRVMKIKSAHKPSTKSSTKKVRFKFKHPDTKSLVLVGSFTAWEAQAVSLVESEPGLWEVEIDLPSGRHEYLFITGDGVWLQDPAAAAAIANPFGGCNSVVEVAPL